MADFESLGRSASGVEPVSRGTVLVLPRICPAALGELGYGDRGFTILDRELLGQRVSRRIPARTGRSFGVGSVSTHHQHVRLAERAGVWDGRGFAGGVAALRGSISGRVRRCLP